MTRLPSYLQMKQMGLVQCTHNDDGIRCTVYVDPVNMGGECCTRHRPRRPRSRGRYLPRDARPATP